MSVGQSYRFRLRFAGLAGPFVSVRAFTNPAPPGTIRIAYVFVKQFGTVNTSIGGAIDITVEEIIPLSGNISSFYSN